MFARRRVGVLAALCCLVAAAVAILGAIALTRTGTSERLDSALALALHELTGAASAELAEAAAADTTYRVEIERALAGTVMPSSN